MNIDFDIKCTTGGFALEYPVNECLQSLLGGGGQSTPPIPPCAIPPLFTGNRGIGAAAAAFPGAGPVNSHANSVGNSVV